VYFYIYKIIIHSAPTYIMLTQTFILDVINRLTAPLDTSTVGESITL